MDAGKPHAEPWTIRRVVAWATDDFKARGMQTARLDAELLLGQVLKIDRIKILTDGERPLQPEELAKYKALILRRRAHEPVAYLRGEREFFGRNFKVDARVLIPRPDTECLVEVALERTQPISLWGRMLDLCTGSGCVAITFARERKTWRVDGTDISDGALSLARENAHRLGAIWNVRWLQSDLFAALSSHHDRYELITANPPYIPSTEVDTLDPDVRDHEPRLALDGGADGYLITRKIVEQAPSFLTAGGVLALEVMSGQARDVAKMFETAGLTSIRITNDYAGHERVVSGRRMP
ncbi:MAG: peptide chain release factor N(5)-glutamine methyltransferase [Polyangiaceae bacterium]